MMVIVISGLLIGCAHNVTLKGWVREGTPIEQLQQDYHKCVGPVYVKDGMTEQEYERDWEFCDKWADARYKKGMDLAWVSTIASEIVIYTARDLRHRCLVTKGYTRNTAPRSEEEISLCMESRGYKWK